MYLLVRPVNFFGQETYDFGDDYYYIDSVRLEHQHNAYKLFIYSNHLESASKSWTKLAAEICTHRLQQMGEIPFRSEDVIISILICPGSTWRDEYAHIQPQIRQLGFVLLPLYRQMCEEAINYFTPAQIADFEDVVTKEIRPNHYFKFQNLLLDIARTNRQDPDPETEYQVKKIADYYEQYPYSDSRVANFVVDWYDYMLDLQDEPVIIDD